MPAMNVGGNNSLTWPPGATVKVFFYDNVSPERRAIYEQALRNWGGVQGVTFTTDVETGMAQYTMSIVTSFPMEIILKGVKSYGSTGMRMAHYRA